MVVKITGVPAGNKAARRNVDTWFSQGSNPKKYPREAIQVSLYILGLQSFQDADFYDAETGKLSFYRIAAIHGWPQKTPWDDVDPLKTPTGYNFCIHGDITFPTWHRPYLALYEQCIWTHMKKIVAEQVPAERQAEWNDAADNWRLPYWNYAFRPAICDIAAKQDVTILDPKNPDKTITVNNPNYRYKLINDMSFGDDKMGSMKFTTDPGNKSTPDNYLPMKMTKGTSRYAIHTPYEPSAPWTEGISESAKVTAAFKSHNWYDPKATGTMRENVYRLVTGTYFESWRAFASTKYHHVSPDANNWLSLELVHNNAHNWTGGQNTAEEGAGHMTFIETAAFDPIFWLHHNFIDLVLCLWQIRTNNKYWFNDQVTSDDPKPTDWLVPFHKADGGQFTSNDCKDWTKLNYSWDLLKLPNAALESDDGEPDEAALAKKLNRLFSTTRSEVLDEREDDENLVSGFEAPPDYVINITYNKHILNEPYSIHLFAGPELEGFTDREQPNRLGTVYTFSRFNPADTCPNCKKQIENRDLSMAQIPITGAMIKDVHNPSFPDAIGLGNSEIEEYLKWNLVWKIVTVTGKVIEAKDLPDLKVTVFAGNGIHHEDPTMMSTYENYQPLFGATAGKPGGASEETGAF